ncbi:MAG: hypothetical protein HKP31_06600 [Nitrosopumilus sp.]|nr:hypothetical protein [Nitrosopumilus sp.]
MENLFSTAFVLIMCKHDSATDVTNQLDHIDTVKEITTVDGPWRMIVKLESSNLDHIRDAIRYKLRRISGIETTLTLVKYMQ